MQDCIVCEAFPGHRGSHYSVRDVTTLMFSQRGHQRGAMQWSPLPGTLSMRGNRILATTHTPQESEARHAEGIWLLEQMGGLMGQAEAQRSAAAELAAPNDVVPEGAKARRVAKPSQFSAYFGREHGAAGDGREALPASASLYPPATVAPLNLAPPEPTEAVGLPPAEVEPEPLPLPAQGAADPVAEAPAPEAEITPPEPEPKPNLEPPAVAARFVDVAKPTAEPVAPPAAEAAEAPRGEDTTLYISWAPDGLSAEVHAVLGTRAQRGAEKLQAALKHFWSEDGVHAKMLEEPTDTEVKIALQALPGRQAKFFLTLGNLVDTLTQRRDPELVVLTEK